LTVPALGRATLALVVAGTALLGAACDSERRAISRDDLPDVPSEPDHVVVLGDDGFDTDELRVLTSELVEFQIVGEDDHGIRADTRIDTGLLFPGESTFVIFDQPGEYEVVDVTDEDQVLQVKSVPDPDE
jgi:plastocyanin